MTEKKPSKENAGVSLGIKSRLKNMGRFALEFFKWALISAVIGILCGLLGALFYFAVEQCDGIFSSFPRAAWFLPLVGVVIVALDRVLKTTGIGTDTVIESAGSGTSVRPFLIPSVFAGTMLTHLGGASSGKEGAAFQMGGAIGSQIASIFRLSKEEVRICIMSGMAAFFAAVFGLPVTAVFFVTMVINVGAFWTSAVFPELVASLIAAAVSGRFVSARIMIQVSTPDASVVIFLKVALLAALSGILSSVFCDGIHLTGKMLKKWIPNDFLRIAVSGAVIALIIMISGTTLYSGSGTEMILMAAGSGQAEWYDFILKLVLTCLTLGAGFKGGEVFPSFAIGASFGCVIGSLLGLPAEFGAAVGLVALFCGASNSLIASVFLAIEMFGIQGINYYVFACVISYMISGYTGFYSHQNIIYSKLYPKIVNRHANDYRDE